MSPQIPKVVIVQLKVEVAGPGKMFSPSSSHQPGDSDKVEGVGLLVAGYAQSFYHHFSGSWGRGPHEGSVDVEGRIEPVVVVQGDGVKALEDIFHPREEGWGLLKGRQHQPRKP